MVGNAVIDACRKLRRAIVSALAEAWQVEPTRVRLIEGQALDLEDPARAIPIAEAFQLAEERFDTLGATGSYTPPELGGDYRGGKIGAAPAYSFTAHVVECESTSRPVASGSSACGARTTAAGPQPMLVAGQIEGSVYMGIAEALLEEHTLNRFGLHAGPRCSTTASPRRSTRPRSTP